ncbi:MAG: DUF2914 domain-containing protein [Bdellovibrionales bacterium]|nr:DUF2914 domain-containing protein [Bdellovibrionales bacterium]
MSNTVTPTTPPPSSPNSRMGRLRAYYDQNEDRFTIGFFVGGFIFDMLLVARIDSWETIGQQIVYLALILFALMQMFFEQVEPPKDHSTMFVLKRWYYEYRSGILHFFFGTLLNMYTIFFFKSSSLLVSFGFLIVIVFLMVANESHRFRALGLPFKFGLFALCSLAFFSGLVPIFVGYMGTAVFMFSMVIGCLPMIGVVWWIQTYRPLFFEQAKSQILLPMSGVLIIFVSLYLLKLTPPVPLSIPFMGVYHGVEKAGDEYQLANERPWWKFWQHGDQNFVAQKGDKIYVAFRIFSPTRFSDQVQMRWFWKDNRTGWEMQDTIPIRIVGGREEGFRGYGTKSNYQPGEWKVQVETNDGREIGRIYFTVELSPEEPRSFEYDTM